MIKNHYLSIDKLRATIDLAHCLFKELSFIFHPGHLYLIQGPNGIGKTSLLKILIGQSSHYKGTINWLISGDQVKYLPQSSDPFFFLPIQVKHLIKFEPLIFNHPRIKDKFQISLLERQWNHLSGGEKQFIFFIKLLEFKPKVLLIDELFNHLDKQNMALIKQLIDLYLSGDLFGYQGSIIMVDHQNILIDHEKSIIISLKESDHD